MSNPPLRCIASVSGCRGVVGSTLDPPTVMGLAAAFAARRRGPVVLGRDSRASGPVLAAAVRAGVRGCGRDLVDLGVVPTPTVALQARRLRAGGGIQISASHNPAAWNALKFFGSGGRILDRRGMDRLLADYAADRAPWVAGDELGAERREEGSVDAHLARILPLVDRERIAAAGLTVLVDSVNGAGGGLAAALLDALGCRLVPLHDNPARDFPRDPEPTAENLGPTCRLVAAAGADLGFVQDPDADRLAVIDERGRYVGEEYTVVLCAAARFAAAKEAGEEEPAACVNLSTSRMIEDLAAGCGARVHRTPIGEAHVVAAMRATGAVIGGEGNGGVIDPRVVWCRDSHVAMALILERLAREGRPLGGLVADLPAYRMRKLKIPCPREAVDAAIPALRRHPAAADAEIDERDGIKLAWPDRWVHLRASGTEPAARIIGEAPRAAEAKRLVALVRKLVPERVDGTDGSES